MRIGIDVGGTNTDAALMDGNTVIAVTKQETSADVTSGVTAAIEAVLGDTSVAAEDIEAVMVGTTHFVNAFIQRRELNPVAIVRVALPMTSGIPPLIDWPDSLRSHIGDHTYLVGGGSYFTGLDYAGLDEEALAEAAQAIKAQGLNSVAITSVFAPIRPDLEVRAQEIIQGITGPINFTLSHQVGSIGLIERENAAVINASLQNMAKRVMRSLRDAMATLSIHSHLYISQNDGTLMDASYAERYPVMTCSAGPTNSIRGAAFLSGVKEAVVVDIGGTSTDVGVLTQGFARETIDSSDLGGVRTNFSMPDVLSIALGGGTIVRVDDEGTPILGPDSVGFRLLRDGKSFGGDKLTTTDIAVKRGLQNLGDPSHLENLSETVADRVSAAIHRKVEGAIDQLKTSATAVPVVLVGGGAILVDQDLAGASQLIRPPNAAVANAIGAAIAQVGGRVRRLFDFGAGSREQILQQAIDEARQIAVRAGADESSVEVVEIEEFPMTHMQTNSVEVHVRVAGDLAALKKETTQHADQ